MVSVYNDADYLAVYKQKKRILGVFWAVTVCYLALCLGCLIYHISLPYAAPNGKVPKNCVWFASVLYAVFIFPFMGIKFSRVRRYFRMLTYVSEGLKNEEKNYFYCFAEKSLQKDNIDVVGCVFETWNKKKQEWMEREAYTDPEKPMPELESGDYVRYITQSNFIIQYEVLQHRALEFEEEDEYEDEVVEEEIKTTEETEE